MRFTCNTWSEPLFLRPGRTGNSVRSIQELQHQRGQWTQHGIHYRPRTWPCVSVCCVFPVVVYLSFCSHQTLGQHHKQVKPLYLVVVTLHIQYYTILLLQYKNINMKMEFQTLLKLAGYVSPLVQFLEPAWNRNFLLSCAST